MPDGTAAGTATPTGSVRVRFLTQGGAAGSERHGQDRERRRLKRVDADRIHLNRHWHEHGGRLVPAEGPVRLVEAARRIADAHRAKPQTPKPGARAPAIASDLLFVASRPLFEDDRGRVCPERARRWAEAVLDAVKARYGEPLIAGARLDLDETTPHLTVFLVPVVQKAAYGSGARATGKRTPKRQRAPRNMLSHAKLFAGRGAELQDWYASVMHEAGYAYRRGTPKAVTGAQNLPPREREAIEARLRGPIEDALRPAIRAEEEARAEARSRAREAERERLWRLALEEARAQARDLVLARAAAERAREDALAEQRAARQTAIEARAEAQAWAERARARLAPLEAAVEGLADALAGSPLARAARALSEPLRRATRALAAARMSLRVTARPSPPQMPPLRTPAARPPDQGSEQDQGRPGPRQPPASLGRLRDALDLLLRPRTAAPDLVRLGLMHEDWTDEDLAHPAHREEVTRSAALRLALRAHDERADALAALGLPDACDPGQVDPRSLLAGDRKAAPDPGARPSSEPQPAPTAQTHGPAPEQEPDPGREPPARPHPTRRAPSGPSPF